MEDMLLGKFLLISGMIGFFTLFIISLIKVLFSKDRAKETLESLIFGISGAVWRNAVGKITALASIVLIALGFMILLMQ